MAVTSPDGIYWPADPNLPANVTQDMQLNAASVQTALNRKAATTDMAARSPDIMYPVQHSTWTDYQTITAVDNYIRLGNWVAVPARSTPGVWRLTCMTYCDVTGGTSSEQGMSAGINILWRGGVTAEWAGMGVAAIGRVTAPVKSRLVLPQVTTGYVVNVDNGRQLVAAPSATLLGGAAAGGSVKAGLSRMSIEFLPYVDPITPADYPA